VSLGKPFDGLVSVPLRSEDYRLLRDLFCERFGLWFGTDYRFLLERRLRERLAVLRLESYAEYYQFLRYGVGAADEWDALADAITNHETYFFREMPQLRSLRDELLPIFVERNGAERRLRVWSAACSTGEEPYTLAMLILESGLFSGWDVRVFGSDVSKACVATARRGVYGGSSFRATDDAAKDAWFCSEPRSTASTDPSTDGNERLGVRPTVRALCHFGQMNLLDDERTVLVGACDMIVCRNVLIYFDQPSRKRVIDMFYERLVPGGVLLLGHAESLLNVTTAFELLHLNEDLVYRKPIVRTPPLVEPSSALPRNST